MTPDAEPIPKPKAVLVDLFHTLVVLRHGGERGPPTHEALGVDKRRWWRAFFADAPGRAIGKVRTGEEGFRALLREIGADVPDERLARALAERDRRFLDAFTNPPEETLRGLRAIRDAGVRLALVSNACFDEIGHWPGSELAALFHETVFSCEVGVAKPDPRIYEIALDRLGLTAADALFAGDGGSRELEGARAVGLRTVMVSGHAREIWPERMADRRRCADHEVEDVAELAQRIGVMGESGA